MEIVNQESITSDIWVIIYKESFPIGNYVHLQSGYLCTVIIYKESFPIGNLYPPRGSGCDRLCYNIYKKFSYWKFKDTSNRGMYHVIIYIKSFPIGNKPLRNGTPER